MTRELFALVSLVGAACSSRSSTPVLTEPAVPPVPATEIPIAPDSEESGAWRGQHDFTGDGVPDRIEDTFSGGAHCCYKLSMVDGKSGVRVELPFELDGGYPRGLDLSQPERFSIETSARRPARLLLQIETYNGKPYELPADGFGLGVTSHRIAVSFVEGVAIENLRE
jgi:hypothetical protein